MLSLLLCLTTFVIHLSAGALWVTGYWQPVFSTAMAWWPSSSPTRLLMSRTTPPKMLFHKLHQVVQNAPPHDITVILTEANATVSCFSRSDETKSAIGTSFVDSCTNNGRRLLLERLHGSRLPRSNEFTHVKLRKRTSARFQLFSSFSFCVTN